MKVCFLDIDGVLNSIQSVENARRIESNRLEGTGVNDRCFCPMAISNLNVLVEDINNLWFVASSTWRKLHALEEIRQMLSVAGFQYPWRIFDKTPRILSNSYRGNEIHCWLQKHAEEYEVNAFVILDDDSDMDPYKSHLVQTKFQHGFMWEHVIKVKEGFKSGNFSI